MFGEYRFHCRFEGQAFLPGYKGSTLGGVFGRALKTVTCTQGGRECSACTLRMRCLYAQVFETQLAVEILNEKNSSGPPHPFVIEPSLSWETDYMPGQSWNSPFCCSDKQTAT